MSAVPSAPALAFVEASDSELLSTRDAAAGTRASSIVRAPTLAPPYKLMASTPARNARLISASPMLSQRASVEESLRNISSSKMPEVPPIESETASAMVENMATGWSVGILPLRIRLWTSVAPRFMVIPQSPSPTMVSYFVRSLSASPRLCTARRAIASDDSPKPGSVRGGKAAVSLVAPLSPTTTSGRSLLEPRMSSSPAFQTSHALQAGASQGASRSDTSSSLEDDRFRIVTEAPCMSKDVMKLPTSRRVTLHPRLLASSSRYFTHALARMDISKLEVPPRLFTITQSSSPSSNRGTMIPSSFVRP
mmetsp:Transcript_16878/g.34745  ORF Transcript_16878/g.34745 Transcript_16878/m.34745 type:complete len:308 (-) Transcript_16878:784-1707(-)